MGRCWWCNRRKRIPGLILLLNRIYFEGSNWFRIIWSRSDSLDPPDGQLLRGDHYSLPWLYIDFFSQNESPSHRSNSLQKKYKVPTYFIYCLMYCKATSPRVTLISILYAKKNKKNNNKKTYNFKRKIWLVIQHNEHFQPLRYRLSFMKIENSPTVVSQL